MQTLDLTPEGHRLLNTIVEASYPECTDDELNGIYGEARDLLIDGGLLDPDTDEISHVLRVAAARVL